MTPDDELLPCSFCGGAAELDTSQAYRALFDGALGSQAAVYCTECSAHMSLCHADVPGMPHEDVANLIVDQRNRRRSLQDSAKGGDDATD